VKSYETNSMILIVLEMGNDVPQAALVKLGRILSTKMNTKIRVIKKSDPKNIIVQVVAPARVQGINSVWTPDGDVQHIIRISKYDARLLPAGVNELEHLLSMIFNENYKIKITQ
jgi:transcription antitermination factor NusA-like protein